jgi:pantetheine-phosphate adenylyltransferase
MTVAMYPGRFDPVTLGHLDILTRAAAIWDEVVVGVAESSSTLFSTAERIEMFSMAAQDHPNVRVTAIRGLTVDAAREQGATVLVRGLRYITDFNVEFDMALMNRNMAPGIESAFLMTAVEYLYISASRIRELAAFGRDVSEFVPPGVAERIEAKMAAQER